MKFTIIVIIKKITLVGSLLIAMLSYAQANGINANWINPGSGLMSLATDEPISTFNSVCSDRNQRYYFYVIYADHSLPAPRYYLQFLDSAREYATYNGDGQFCAGLLRTYLPKNVTVPISPLDHVSFLGIAPSIMRHKEGYISYVPWIQAWLTGSGTAWKPPQPPEPSKPSCTASSVSINYNSITADTVHNLRKTENLSISCNGAATVKVYTTINNLSLRSDLSANLFINDKAAVIGTQETIIKDRITTVPITAVLNYSKSGNPPSGPFSGSTVIYLDVL